MIETNTDWQDLREGIRSVCKKFSEDYWRELDQKRKYPTKFVNELMPIFFISLLSYLYLLFFFSFFFINTLIGILFLKYLLFDTFFAISLIEKVFPLQTLIMGK